MAREAWKKQRADDIVTSNNKVNPNQNILEIFRHLYSDNIEH